MGKLTSFLLFTTFISLGSILAGPEKPGNTIQDLIDQLASERYADREKADKALRALEVVPPEVLKACRSSNVEIRTRAKAIVTAVESRFTALMLRVWLLCDDLDVIHRKGVTSPNNCQNRQNASYMKPRTQPDNQRHAEVVKN